MFHYKEYDDLYISESLDRFKDINWKLHLLWRRIEQEFYLKQGIGFSDPPSTGTFY